MGYFSNGAEGMDYERDYCDRCVHQEPACPVWGAHLLHNYGASADVKEILNMLIPRDENGFNEQCKLFIERPEEVHE